MSNPLKMLTAERIGLLLLAIVVVVCIAMALISRTKTTVIDTNPVPMTVDTIKTQTPIKPNDTDSSQNNKRKDNQISKKHQKTKAKIRKRIHHDEPIETD